MENLENTKKGQNIQIPSPRVFLYARILLLNFIFSLEPCLFSLVIANKHLIKSLKTIQKYNFKGCIVFYHACIIMYVTISIYVEVPVSLCK